MASYNKKSFDIEFRKHCGEILQELYHNPISAGQGPKRVVINTEKRYVDYLVELNLIKNLNNFGGGSYGLQLERKGYEVFEKYNGWDDYFNKVINRELKINEAKNLAIKYWWVPIGISLISLAVATIALLK